MPETIEIRTEGIGPLLRAFGQFDRELRSNVRGELVAIAGLVAAEARQIAAQKTTRRTGDLISHIRPGFRSNYAYVTDTARHGGYNYPGRLEYEHSGRRAFLHPAMEHKRTEAIVAFEAMLGGLASRHF